MPTPPIINHKHPKVIQAMLSILAAISLAVLIVLTNWNFELRSLQKLAIQTGIVALVLLPLLYWFVFCRIREQIIFKADFLVIFTLVTTLLGVLVVPEQTSILRYMVTLVVTIFSGLALLVSLYQSRIIIKSERVARLVLLVMVIGGAAGMAILLFNSLSMRMYGDDFCYTLYRESRGYLPSVIWFYTYWSGRFFSNFLVMGLSHWRWAVFAQLICILVTTFLTLAAMVSGSKNKRILTALASSLWIAFAVFAVIPNFYKFYWIVASWVVLPVMICIPLYVLVVVLYLKSNSNKKMYWAAPAIFLLSFMIATTQEAALPGWLLAQCIALIWVWRFSPKSRPLTSLLSISLAGALAGFVVEWLAPGVSIRAETMNYPRTTSLTGLISLSTTFFIDFLQKISASGRLMLLTIVGLGWFLETGLVRSAKSAIALLIFTLIITFTCFVPGVYAMTSTVPLRTEVIPGSYLVYGMFMVGLFLPRPKNKELAFAVGVILLLITVPITSLHAIRKLTPTIAPLQQFARDWDARDQLALHSDVEITGINVPWDQWEQKIYCVRNYYNQHRINP